MISRRTYRPIIPQMLVLLFMLNSLSLQGQFISEVLEYVPAPSQHTNSSWSSPDAAETIIGGIGSGVSLGGFGGYIIFRFEKRVENDPDNPFGVDFTLFGNPMKDWAEPGIVQVMPDENGNGLPDDTWFEIRGSDHGLPSTIYNYQVTYFAPESEGEPVKWVDNLDSSGVIVPNSYHAQSYYPDPNLFPEIPVGQYTLKGTRLESNLNMEASTGIQARQRDYGYADNRLPGKAPWEIPDDPFTPEAEYAGGDAIDLDWAVDSSGYPVSLAAIDFVRVHTGVMDHAGILGQVSTELRGAVDVAPDAEFSKNITSMDPGSSNEHGISVYPNPASDKLYLQGNWSGRVSITDLSGKQVWSSSPLNHTKSIALDRFRSGVYFLQIATSNGQETHKFVVAR